MKIQFVKLTLYDSDIVAEFDVAEEPTEEQCKAIQEEIDEVMDAWDEENDGDFSEFDYWGGCYEAVRKNVRVVENRVVKTFYL